ncbi:MAG: lysophospholipid acyltransferase family protein, partial [Alcaligenes aquatilis]
MSFNSYPLLKSVFTYFGRASVRSRQRWGAVLGALVHRFASRRRHIVRTNLDLCFPDTPESTRREWEKQHFRLLAQSYLDRGLLWFGLPSTILNTLHLTGEEHITQALEQGRKVMLLVPHFLGMDAAGTRLSMSISPLVAFYTPQRDPHVDRLMYEGRSRFSS